MHKSPTVAAKMSSRVKGTDVENERKEGVGTDREVPRGRQWITVAKRSRDIKRVPVEAKETRIYIYIRKSKLTLPLIGHLLCPFISVVDGVSVCCFI